MDDPNAQARGGGGFGGGSTSWKWRRNTILYDNMLLHFYTTTPEADAVILTRALSHQPRPLSNRTRALSARWRRLPGWLPWWRAAAGEAPALPAWRRVPRLLAPRDIASAQLPASRAAPAALFPLRSALCSLRPLLPEYAPADTAPPPAMPRVPRLLTLSPLGVPPYEEGVELCTSRATGGGGSSAPRA